MNYSNDKHFLAFIKTFMQPGFDAIKLASNKPLLPCISPCTDNPQPRYGHITSNVLYTVSKKKSKPKCFCCIFYKSWPIL